MNRMDVGITTEYIKLDSLLKLSGAAETGAAAKYAVQDGQVRVNGETELRRGKKMRPGDVAEYEDFVITVRLGDDTE